MSENSFSYNLLEEQWIPVLYHDGRWERVGILQAFKDAGRIRQIAASNPMDRFAILRFLLALLYWYKGNPPEMITCDFVFDDLFNKLEDNKDCFNLLGNGKRFYQDKNAKRPRSITDLIQEIPAGNNFWHFRHSTDGTNGLCLACSAMGLLRLPLFSVSGLPDLKSGINGTPPIYIIPCGTTLSETLKMNWISVDEIGVPAWIQPDIYPSNGDCIPLVTGLTMLSRRVFLHAPVKQPGVCIGCGERETLLILDCEFQTAGRQENDQWQDPHVIYSDGPPRRSTKAPDLRAAGKFKMDRPWPDLLSRLVEKDRFLPNQSMYLFVVGFSTSKALNIDVWEKYIPITPSMHIQKTIGTQIQQWQKESYNLIRKIRPHTGKTTTRIHVEIPSIINSIRPCVEDRVSAKVGELLSDTDGAWENAASEYRPMMEMVAKSLSPGFTTKAVQWRQQITRTMPDMKPKEDAKPGKKKGEK